MKSRSRVLDESVILQACQKMVEILVGNKNDVEISKFPLSNNTIQRTILTIADTIEESVIAKLRKTLFVLQINEFTDISNYLRLMAFICFIEDDAIIYKF